MGTINARFVHRDNFTFRASHSLLATTNYVPVVNETDHGARGVGSSAAVPVHVLETRRSAEARGPPTDQATQHSRPGSGGTDDQHDVMVTWAVDGSIRYYTDVANALQPTERLEADTPAWRADADRILGFWKSG